MAVARDLTARLRRIRLLVCDVDGVLTDGSIIMDDQGREQKKFSVLDGTAFVLARLGGISGALLSGRRSGVVTVRARECGITLLAQGVSQKAPAFAELCRRAGVTAAQAAYVGDDLIDLPALEMSGLAVAVANARPEVKRQAQWVTRTPGGQGVVREVVERLLRAQGSWPKVLGQYLKTHDHAQ